MPEPDAAHPAVQGFSAKSVKNPAPEQPETNAKYSEYNKFRVAQQTLIKSILSISPVILLLYSIM